jgi:hypothetical protein
MIGNPLITSPRLWGEVGICACARMPGEGHRPELDADQSVTPVSDRVHI